MQKMVERLVGADIELLVPLDPARGSFETDPSQIQREQVPRDGETILLVDDEDTLRVLIARMLEKAGYLVMRAPNGPEALRLAASHAGPIDLIVTDLMMPEMRGPDMVNRIRHQRPGIRVLYLSGYTEATVMREGLLGEGENFLQKPFAADTFTRRVREILDGPSGAR